MRKIDSVIEAKDQPFVVQWSDRDVNWRVSTIPFIDRNGWQGALLSPCINAANIRFFPYFLPMGQARPFHIAENLELVIFLLEGEMEWGVGPSGAELTYYKLGKFDTLFVPRGLGVDYRNCGQCDARYIMANSPVGAWPTECVYEIPGQDKPYVRKF